MLGPVAAPVALVLGRPDVTGRLRVVGRTGPLHRDVRPVLGAVLRPAGYHHPWPAVLPPARCGDVGPVGYTRGEPRVVVELAVDAAVDDVRGRPVWRHAARFQRLRLDLGPRTCRAADMRRVLTAVSRRLPISQGLSDHQRRGMFAACG